MLLSKAFLLALIATLYSSSTAQSLQASTKSFMSKEQQQLALIRRAQEQQQRKLLTVEFKLNQMISKLISCTHTDIAGSITKALSRWQSDSNKTFDQMQQQINRIQLSFQAREEYATILEEIHSMVAMLLTKRESTRKELVQVSVEGETNANNSNQESAAMDNLQPAKADCSELDQRELYAEGVYKFLEPDLNERQRDFNERHCVFATAGAAWTLIQQRHEAGQNRESFQRSWNEYRAGFGELNGEFWFGNEYIHRLVYRDDYELRIELEDVAGERAWAEYAFFRLDSEIYSYQLEIGQPHENNTANDALSYHNGMEFKASDSDVPLNCVGWWFDRCPEGKSNLNGAHILWGNWHNEYQLKASRMLIRPRHLDTQNTDEIFDENS